MPIPPEQAEVARFLRGLAGGPPKETHISVVFLGTDTAWKLKKAVRLSFLDFSTVEARHRFLLRELALNRRAAPGLYRDVAAIVRGADGRPALTAEPGKLPVLDWVLRMARVPDADFLESVAARGGLTPALLDALGDAVAAFHAALPPVHPWDSHAALRRTAEGNAVAALAAGLDGAAVRAWCEEVLAALDARRDWLAARAGAGFVRRAHGDLHLGNLCLWQGRPVPFDALEFDEELATIDLGYDLAFLLVDLDRRAGREAANRVLNRYVARSGDAALTAGLPPFLSLRAMVRAHVGAARGSGPEDAARELAAARDYLRPAPSLVLAIGGLQGTGKSTLARALAPEIGPAPGALVLRSDEIRKRLHGATPEARLPAGAYDAAANVAVNAALTGTAGAVAKGGHAAIADATFLDAAQRAGVAAAARAAGMPFLGVWLEAPLAVLEARIAARQGDASDATIDILRRFAAADPGPLDWLRVDARESGPALAAVRAAVAGLRHGESNG